VSGNGPGYLGGKIRTTIQAKKINYQRKAKRGQKGDLQELRPKKQKLKPTAKRVLGTEAARETDEQEGGPRLRTAPPSAQGKQPSIVSRSPKNNGTEERHLCMKKKKGEKKKRPQAFSAGHFHEKKSKKHREVRKKKRGNLPNRRRWTFQLNRERSGVKGRRAVSE